MAAKRIKKPTWMKGVFADRPVASAAFLGDVFYATDTHEEYVCLPEPTSGAARWRPVGLGEFTLTAGADLSTKQYHWIAPSAAGAAVLAGLGGAGLIGVLQNAPANGEVAIIRCIGKSTIMAGAAIAIQQYVTSNAAGRAKSADGLTTNTSDGGAAQDPTSGSIAGAMALSAAAGDGSTFTGLIMLAGALPLTVA